MKPQKQQCSLWSVWLTWIALPVLAIWMGVTRGWFAGVFVLTIGVVAQAAYIKLFPKISRWMGYGSVEDVAPESPTRAKPTSTVTLYTANVCPFCPIVRSRLAELQPKLGFELAEVDITFRPDVIAERGFRSVPVVEVDGRYHAGNATSAELAAFITTWK